MTELDQQQEGAEMQSDDYIEADASTVEAPAGVGKDALEIETPDDLALVQRMQEGHQQIVAEILKVIVGLTQSVSLVP